MFKQFNVGIDLKMVRYQKFNVSDGMITFPGLLPTFAPLSVQPKIYSAALRISYQF